MYWDPVELTQKRRDARIRGVLIELTAESAASTERVFNRLHGSSSETTGAESRRLPVASGYSCNPGHAAPV